MFNCDFVRILNFEFVVSSIERDVTKAGVGKSSMKDVKCSVSGMKKKRLRLFRVHECVQIKQRKVPLVGQ